MEGIDGNWEYSYSWSDTAPVSRSFYILFCHIGFAHITCDGAVRMMHENIWIYSILHRTYFINKSKRYEEMNDDGAEPIIDTKWEISSIMLGIQEMVSWYRYFDQWGWRWRWMGIDPTPISLNTIRRWSHLVQYYIEVNLVHVLFCHKSIGLKACIVMEVFGWKWRCWRWVKHINLLMQIIDFFQNCFQLCITFPKQLLIVLDQFSEGKTWRWRW